MNNQNPKFLELLELANHYPSPHNGQPVRAKILDDNTLELYFANERGLRSNEISFIFSFVSMGVFVQHLSMCAQALGHGFSYQLDLPVEAELREDGLVRFATCQLSWDQNGQNVHLKEVLSNRHTSRKKYHEDVSEELAARLILLAGKTRMRLVRLDKAKTKQAIWLNQRAVFDDMFDEPVRRELDHWLRYTKKEKETKKDGLAYDCMELSGRSMKLSVRHPGILRLPILSSFIKSYYTRTMMDESSVFYMMAPFANERAAYNVGLTVMMLWEAVAEAGYSLHPFGTIMSNRQAHQDFMNLAGEHEETRMDSYLVFIFRCGKSDKPAPSLRLSIKDHLLMEP